MFIVHAGSLLRTDPPTSQKYVDYNSITYTARINKLNFIMLLQFLSVCTDPC